MQKKRTAEEPGAAEDTGMWRRSGAGREACRDLHGMLNFEGENEVFREYTANYRMNLYTLEDLKEEHFTTGLRDVVAMMKRADNKEAGNI